MEYEPPKEISFSESITSENKVNNFGLDFSRINEQIE